MNRSAENYFIEGCGRCPLGGTPACKVQLWREELYHLRRIVLDSPLTETCKWGVPCYMYQDQNVLLIGAFKEYCSLSFFKGVLMPDPQGILLAPGENSQSARVIKFTNVDEVLAQETILHEYLMEAIAVEQAGKKVEFKKISEYPLPEELEQVFEAYPTLRIAFKALTPGRQRGYLLHFSAAKQAKTREARIQKCIPLILQGKGMNE